MLIPTHIVQVPGFRPPEIVDLIPECKSGLIYVRAYGNSGGVLSGPQAHSESGAIASWNSIFGKGVA